jgi:hypothetical protein
LRRSRFAPYDARHYIQLAAIGEVHAMVMLISGYSSVRVELGDAHFDGRLDTPSAEPDADWRAAYRRIHSRRSTLELSLLARAVQARARKASTQARAESGCAGMWLHGFLIGFIIGRPQT